MKSSRSNRNRGVSWLPSALLLTASLAGSAAAVPPALLEPTYLPGDDQIAPAIGRQSDPEIAAGGDGYLVVWVDDRSSITTISSPFGAPAYNHHTGTKWDIYAARLDAEGNLIDQTPIVVTQELLMQAMPAVAWNGENWLVAWSGQTGTYECCPTYSMFAARVTPTGEVLDDPPITVDLWNSYSADLIWSTVGSDGNNWVVVWRDLDGQIWTLDATRIAPDGTVLDPGGVFVRHDTQNSYPVDPDIVWAGDEYLLVWEEGSGGVRGQRLTADLQTIGNVFDINVGYWTGYNPRVATDGTDFFVTWWSELPQFSELAGSRVTHGGTVLDSPPILLTAASDITNYEPSIAWDGTDYVVVYSRYTNPYGDVYAARVTPDGVVLDYDTAAIPVSTEFEWQDQVDIAAAPGGAGSMIVWRDNRDRLLYTTTPFGDVYGASFSPSGSVGTEQCVATGAPRQTLLRLTPDGEGYLAVYRSETSPETRILAQRLDAAGMAIDVEPIIAASGDNALTNPSAAWNGFVYLVVWENLLSNETFGRRFAPDLTPLDADPISIMPGNWPDVAAIGDNFLVVTSWEEPHEVRGGYGVRVRGSDGAVLDPTPRLFSSGYTVLPRVATVGDRWLAVWQSHATHDDPGATAKGNFIDQSNVPSTWFYVDTDAKEPSVVGGPDQAMISFAGRASGRQIYARRVLPDGTFLDPTRGITLIEEYNDQFEPVVAWTGSEYVVAWTDFRNTLIQDYSPPGDIFGGRVSEEGEALDPGGFPILDAPAAERFAAVGGRDGGFIAGGSSFRNDSGFVNYRISLRRALRTVDVDEISDERQVTSLRLEQNPVTETAGILFTVGTEMAAGVDVYDATGRHLRHLYEGRVHAGTMRLSWDGRDERGLEVGSGVYFIRARSGSEMVTTRLIRL